MKSNKNRLAVVLLFAGALLLGACVGEGGEKTADAGSSGEAKQEISIRINNDPDFLDPHQAEASITFQMILNMYDGLLAGDTDGSLIPAIAEDHEISEDGLVYTFDIREGVKFHNGEDVTVNDIVYSFERLMGTVTGEPLSSDFDNIASLGTPDEHTFVITLKEPDSTFISYLTALNAAIIPESNDGNHNNQPIGTGPFKFASYSPESELVLEKNTAYWKEGLPYLEKVAFRFQQDDQAAMLALQAGEIDILSIASHRIPEVEGEFQISVQDANSVLLVGFNQDREPFDDSRVRQAINYAINKEDIIEAAFSGYATPLGTNMSPAMGAVYHEGLEEVYGNDIERAKELLAEAGYPEGFSSTISISTHAGMYTNVAQVVAENLKQIGIELEIEVVEWGVWLERIYQGRDYDMTVIDFTGELSPYETMERYLSTADNNFFGFKNAEFDEVMAEVVGETDEGRQLELYQRAQEILNEDAAAAYLADYQFIWAMNKNLEGYQSYPYFFHDLSEVRFIK